MGARSKPYEQFGPYILFKRLESDQLGELWRAGRIEGAELGSTVALRRFTGNPDALSQAVLNASRILPQLTGTSFVRNQRAEIVDGVPVLSWEYGGGRSLRQIIDRSRGGKNVAPNPLPLDQAIAIAERVALSLATLAELRDSTGSRLSHGGLLPQCIWINDDGEIRVAGQQIGTGLTASMNDANVVSEIGRYFSPEYRATGQAEKTTDVYSMGAILFLLVTGQEPPDAATASAFGAAVRAAKTMLGAPMPDDIRVVLDKSFNIDPSMRYPSMVEMKQALSGLANSGKYSASTFNLAFYLSMLLKKEMESEAVDRENESKVNVAAYLDTPRTPVPASEPPFSFGVAEGTPPRRNVLPIAIAATVVVAAGIGGWIMFGKSSTNAAQTVSTQSMAPLARATQPVLSEPVVASPAATSTTPTTVADGDAQKQAFEEAVRRKLQDEMMKLQGDYMTELKQRQSRNAPVSAPTPAPVQLGAAQTAIPPAEDRAALTAAQLDQQRRDAREEAAAVAPPTAAPAPAQPLATTQTAAPAAVQTVAAVRQGDVVDISVLDSVPRPTRPIRPTYPPLAARQKISATVILTALITEDGEVADVKVLKGDARFGLNDAAIRALRATRFSPPMKSGQRVRTWYPQSIEFKP